jgi:hypothetical protein
LSSVVAFVTLTPTPKFLALSPKERLPILERIIAPVREWTGESGGIFFTERAEFNDGRWIVALGVSILVEQLGEVFQKAIQDAQSDGYFGVWGIAGERLPTAAEDTRTSRLAMDHIFQQFID